MSLLNSYKGLPPTSKYWPSP